MYGVRSIVLYWRVAVRELISFILGPILGPFGEIGFGTHICMYCTVHTSPYLRSTFLYCTVSALTNIPYRPALSRSIGIEYGLRMYLQHSVQSKYSWGSSVCTWMLRITSNIDTYRAHAGESKQILISVEDLDKQWLNRSATLSCAAPTIPYPQELLTPILERIEMNSWYVSRSWTRIACCVIIPYDVEHPSVGRSGWCWVDTKCSFELLQGLRLNYLDCGQSIYMRWGMWLRSASMGGRAETWVVHHLPWSHSASNSSCNLTTAFRHGTDFLLSILNTLSPALDAIRHRISSCRQIINDTDISVMLCWEAMPVPPDGR